MFTHIEKVMTIVTNRKQRITTSNIINSVERMTKKEFDIHHFRTLVSLNLFNVQLVDGGK